MHWVDCICCACACFVGMCLSSNLGWSYFRERSQLIGCFCADIIAGSEEQQACQDLSVTHAQSTVCNVPVYSTQSTNTGLILYGTMKEHMEGATKGLCAHLHIGLFSYSNISGCKAALEAERISLVELSFSGRGQKVWQYSLYKSHEKTPTMLRSSVNTFRLPYPVCGRF